MWVFGADTWLGSILQQGAETLRTKADNIRGHGCFILRLHRPLFPENSSHDNRRIHSIFHGKQRDTTWSFRLCYYDRTPRFYCTRSCFAKLWFDLGALDRTNSIYTTTGNITIFNVVSNYQFNAVCSALDCIVSLLHASTEKSR
mmetsp:Transcript_42944/g.62935  ORF Transcript_42944/g.62935 Transcript_42944/m.62935 type:complete len:144 (+) Transcript_42944:1083-1514(+)